MSSAKSLLRRQAAAWLVPYQDNGSIYDMSFWPWMEYPPPQEAEEFLKSLPAPSDRTWHVAMPDPQESIEVEARVCSETTGAWPISFSHPRRVPSDRTRRAQLISSIVPGRPYSFEREAPYYSEYANSYLAVTHRKAGWDCFRHVEILSTGAIPLMLDASRIPRFSMIHYPKSALISVIQQAVETGDAPDAATLQAFNDWYLQHLTSESMARYMLRSAGLEGAERVLFVDRRLPVAGDYQSALALVGLKHVFGKACEVLYQTKYIYSDWTGSSQTLYGRGFGYSRSVDPSLRSPLEGHHGHRKLKRDLKHGRFDAVVIGSISRNGPLAHALAETFDPRKTIWVHGEDQPPSPREMYFMRTAGTHLFVRSIPEWTLLQP